MDDLDDCKKCCVLRFLLDILSTNLIACDRDIACVQVSDAVDMEGGLIFGWVGHGYLVEKLVFVLGDDVDDRCSINVGPIGFGIDGDEDNFVLGLQVVDGAITAAFAFLDIAVFETDFVDDRFDAFDAIAGGFALEELVDKGLEV